MRGIGLPAARRPDGIRAHMEVETMSYTIERLREMRLAAQASGASLHVEARGTRAAGTTPISGPVVGMGSKLAIQAGPGIGLAEDIRPESVTSAWLVPQGGGKPSRTVTVRKIGRRFTLEFSALPGRTFGPWDLAETVQDLAVSALLPGHVARDLVLTAHAKGSATAATREEDR